jgi:hypothetical protein
VFKQILTFLLSLLSMSVTISQVHKSVIIYASNNDFLTPLIEQQLLNLQYANKKEKIFQNVTNLNRFSLNKSSEIALRELLDYYSNNNIIVKKIGKDSLEEKKIDSLLRLNEYFLEIKINTLNDLLEYQFFLYKSSDLKSLFNNGNAFPSNDIIKPIKIENLFINAGSNNYQGALIKVIRKIFPESNSVPILRLAVKNNIITDTLIVAVNDSLTLDASFSSDDDDPFEDLKFNWITNPDKENLANFYFNSKGPFSKLVFFKEGIYKIRVSVSDDIAVSKEDTIIFKIKSRPEIIISPHEIYYLDPPSFFLNKKYIETKINILNPDLQNIKDYAISFEKQTPLVDSLNVFLLKLKNKKSNKNKSKLIIDDNIHIVKVDTLVNGKIFFVKLNTKSQINSYKVFATKNGLASKKVDLKFRSLKFFIFPISLAAGFEFNSFVLKSRFFNIDSTDINFNTLSFQYSLNITPHISIFYIYQQNLVSNKPFRSPLYRFILDSYGIFYQTTHVEDKKISFIKAGLCLNKFLIVDTTFNIHSLNFPSARFELGIPIGSNNNISLTFHVSVYLPAKNKYFETKNFVSAGLGLRMW